MPSRRRAVATTVFATITLAAAALPAFVPAFAVEPADDLNKTEQDLRQERERRRLLDERAAKLEEERQWLSAQLVALAEESRRREGDLTEIESALETLRVEEAEKAAVMEGERARLAELLAALQRLARIPPEAALLRPDAPVDALRSALLLRNIVPALREEAAVLARTLEQLAEVRRQLEEQRERAVAARRDLDGRAQQIALLSAQREKAARQTEAERQATAQRTARLAAQAVDLRQLMEKVEQERRAAATAAQRRETERIENERRVAAAQEAARREAEKQALAADKKESERKAAEAERAARRLSDLQAADSRAAAPGAGGLRRPSAGRLTVRFGQTDRQGAESRGVTIAGRPGSPVVSPYSGSIMYAGPFRNFGLILIVEHGNGYHSLLAGLGRIDVAVGRHVVAGEPLGTLPESTEAAGSGRDLYFELRNNGRPVDPERGFADKQGKGHG